MQLVHSEEFAAHADGDVQAAGVLQVAPVFAGVMWGDRDRDRAACTLESKDR